MKPLLELNHVSFSYHSKNGETSALSDISFQVEEGEFIAVVGPSGCGNAMDLSRKQLTITNLNLFSVPYHFFKHGS